MLSSLASSATDLTQVCSPSTSNSCANIVEQRRRRLGASVRSSSFDVSAMPDEMLAPSEWFARRHQPMVNRNQPKPKATIVTFADERNKVATKVHDVGDVAVPIIAPQPRVKPTQKVMWDNRSVVDAHALGSAIEGFLKSTEANSSSTCPPAIGKTNDSGQSSSKTIQNLPKVPPRPQTGLNRPPPAVPPASWYSSPSTSAKSRKQENNDDDKCDSSLCSQLKDLFVK